MPRGQSIMEPVLKLQHCVISVIIIACSSFASEIDRPIVKVLQGQLQGIRQKSINGSNSFFAFRGVPYAQPPIGDLRFQDPEPVEPWSGVKDAKEFGDSCTQYEKSLKKVIGSEDCLFLNIYTTNLNPKEPRAVMVWVHGGAFVAGSGNDQKFGPDYLVQKDVILVTMNYRLGIFGYLNLNDESVPGNQALKDIVMALKWLKQNIDQFGGDPSSVTIFGQSAGSASVHYITLSPLAQGLFQKAIFQSSVASNPRSYVSYPLKDAAEKIAGKLGRTNEGLIDFLRNVDAYDLLEAVDSFKFRKEGYLIENPFVPSVDSKSKYPFLNIPISEAVKAGIQVPHLIGHTSKEAIIFKAGLTDEDYKEINSDQESLLIHPNDKNFLKTRNISVTDVKEFFFGDNEISKKNAQQYIDLVSADYYIFNIHNVLEIQFSVPEIPTYFYKFDYFSKETAVVQNMIDTDLEGTAHSEENYYLFNAKILEKFGISQRNSLPTESIIQRRFLDLWTTFAKTGDPNLATELIPVVWKPVDDSIEYNCLEISKDLNLIKETNLLHQLSAQKK